MPALTLARSVAILREHAAQESSRQVDIAISLRVCDVDTSGPEPTWLTDSDEELVEVGGRWDRRLKRWIGDARSVRILRVPRGSDQEQPARWLAEWFRRHAKGPKGAHWQRAAMIPGREPCVRWGRQLKAKDAVEFRRAWTLMLVGGRRGGKSHLAVVALAMMMVLSPRAITFAVSPTQSETDELEQAMRSLLPREWYSARLGATSKALQFKLANGSRILFLSGHKPRSLKRGRCDMALLNEAQNMYQATWRQLRGAIADKAGIVLFACNPPDETIGRWIDEVYEKIRAKRIAAEVFHLTGKGNPLVTDEALDDMRGEVDDVTARREVDGELGIPIGDIVFHAWSPDSIREPPAHLIDVTAIETKKHLGRAAGYVVGMDFQMQPHEAAAIIKLFIDPTSEHPDEVIPWIVDGVLVEDANEDELLDALERIPRWMPGDRAPDTRIADGKPREDTYRGWIEKEDDPKSPVHCAVVMDASAWWQDSAHQKGKRSDRLLAARRWTFCYRPQKDSDANPQIAERVKVTNARLKTADAPNKPGRRRMFSCAHNLEINRAMAQWENLEVTKQPNRRSVHAHGCDAVSYVVYRFFSIIKPSGRKKAEYRSVGPRRDRGEWIGG